MIKNWFANQPSVNFKFEFSKDSVPYQHACRVMLYLINKPFEVLVMILDHGLGHRHLGNLLFHILCPFSESQKDYKQAMSILQWRLRIHSHTALISFAESLLGMSVTRKKPTQKSHASPFPFKKCMKRTLMSMRKSWLTIFLFLNYVQKLCCSLEYKC